MKSASIIAVALLAGCLASDTAASGDEFVDPWMPDPQPPKCEDTDPALCQDSTGGVQSTCLVTNNCPADEVCVAAFDGDIGTFVCASTCVDANDETRWCSDDSACCDANATCVRGLCLPGAGDTSTSSGDASTAESTGVDTSAGGSSSSTGDATSESGSST